MGTENRRIITIAVSPKAYDEIAKLKGDRTWTGWLLQLMQQEYPDNKVIQDEIANLPKKVEKKPDRNEPS